MWNLCKNQKKCSHWPRKRKLQIMVRVKLTFYFPHEKTGSWLLKPIFLGVFLGPFAQKTHQANENSSICQYFFNNKGYKVDLYLLETVKSVIRWPLKGCNGTVAERGDIWWKGHDQLHKKCTTVKYFYQTYGKRRLVWTFNNFSIQSM